VVRDSTCLASSGRTIGLNVVRGYRNNPEANATAFTDGWFSDWDIGEVDNDGYLALIGRIKELPNRGGEGQSPLSIGRAVLHNAEWQREVAETERQDAGGLDDHREADSRGRHVGIHMLVRSSEIRISAIRAAFARLGRRLGSEGGQIGMNNGRAP
jgi:hypothetical protein